MGSWSVLLRSLDLSHHTILTPSRWVRKTDEPRITFRFLTQVTGESEIDNTGEEVSCEKDGLILDSVQSERVSLGNRG